jgi:hypothetical protein
VPDEAGGDVRYAGAVSDSPGVLAGGGDPFVDGFERRPIPREAPDPPGPGPLPSRAGSAPAGHRRGSPAVAVPVRTVV